MKLSNEPAAASVVPTQPQLSIMRVFAAPVERVWQAWIHPDEMVRWLGPVEYPASEMAADMRVGGAWRACLRARDGADILWQSGHYLDIEPPSLLRFTFRWESANHEDAGVETVVTVRFERLDGERTRLTLIQEGLTSERSVGGHAYGWGSTLDRLAGHLQSEGDGPCS
jgi:uncharacterized protein YndB with AHSA1/START domain